MSQNGANLDSYKSKFPNAKSSTSEKNNHRHVGVNEENICVEGSASMDKNLQNRPLPPTSRICHQCLGSIASERHQNPNKLSCIDEMNWYIPQTKINNKKNKKYSTSNYQALIH